MRSFAKPRPIIRRGLDHHKPLQRLVTRADQGRALHHRRSSIMDMQSTREYHAYASERQSKESRIYVQTRHDTGFANRSRSPESARFGIRSNWPSAWWSLRAASRSMSARSTTTNLPVDRTARSAESVHGGRPTAGGIQRHKNGTHPASILTISRQKQLDSLEGPPFFFCGICGSSIIIVTSNGAYVRLPYDTLIWNKRIVEEQ
jgi:hypothetical protein